jgi:hypothetical protein
MVCFGGALLGNDACPFSETYALKTLTHQVHSVGPLPFCAFKSQVKIFDLKSGGVNARKYSGQILIGQAQHIL